MSDLKVLSSEIILASASPRRAALLRQIGVTPSSAIPAFIDETPYKSELPQAHALRLAKTKAEKIAALHPEAFILAADTVVACGRRILPKAEEPGQAQACLQLLSGRRHRVHTALCLIAPNGKARTRIAETAVQFKRLSEAEISAYIATQEWRGMAGGYAIQGFAESFVKSIQGSYSNVVGLPLYDTMRLLTGAGFFKAL